MPPELPANRSCPIGNGVYSTTKCLVEAAGGVLLHRRYDNAPAVRQNLTETVPRMRRSTSGPEVCRCTARVMFCPDKAKVTRSVSL
jgi:hypothetical protein